MPKKHRGLRQLYGELMAEIRARKGVSIVFFTLRTIVLVTLVLQFLRGNYENVFLCLLTLLLFLLPAFVNRRFNIQLPDTLEVIILFFIFAAEILGEINAYYVKYDFWDTMLHTMNGFLAAAIGFSLVDVLNRSERTMFNLSPLFVAMVAFCFSMTIGVLWEFVEYFADNVLLLDMQKDTIVHTIRSVALDPTATNTVVTIEGITDVVVNGQPLGLGGYLDIGLHDTMEDLLVNFIGAVWCSARSASSTSRGAARASSCAASCPPCAAYPKRTSRATEVGGEAPYGRMSSIWMGSSPRHVSKMALSPRARALLSSARLRTVQMARRAR